MVLFARNIVDPDQLSALTAAIHDARPDAIIALDEEGGEVTRLEAVRGSSWPGNRLLGHLDDVDVTAAVARAIAEKLRAAGITMNLAPVLDVASNPTNPVIGGRSFGADPDLVSRHGRAFVTATQEAGVAACAKHFPGHGDTAVDSHLGLPVVDAERDELEAVHLPPFRAAANVEVAAMMTAHVVYSTIDQNPATLSAPILTDLARRQLHFDGVMVTDALGMAAISANVGLAAGATAALAAGADLLCVTPPYEQQREVRDELQRAFENGKLTKERIAQAAERVRRLTARFPHQPDPASAAAPMDPDGLGLRAARLALREFTPPLLLESGPTVLEVHSSPSGIEPTRVSLGRVLGELIPDTRRMSAVVGSDLGPIVAEATAEVRRPLIVGVRDAQRSSWQRQLVREILAARADAVIVGLGTRDDAGVAPGRYVPATGSAPPNLYAVAEFLTGRCKS